jgi:hypothetical protein
MAEKIANENVEQPTPHAIFRGRYGDLQHLLREWHLLRKHNLTFKPEDRQDTMLMFAEGAVVIISLERFVRAVLGDQADERDALDRLLRKATAGPTPLLRLPWDDQDDGRKKLCAVRNMILHGNFEQAAREFGCDSVKAFFQTQFASTIEIVGKVLENLLEQIDVRTGLPPGHPQRPTDA